MGQRAVALFDAIAIQASFPAVAYTRVPFGAHAKSLVQFHFSFIVNCFFVRSRRATVVRR